MTDGPLLPADGVLLHIGPHKTGTTALQSAFEASRRALREQGVVVTPSKLQRLGAGAVTQRTLGGMALGTSPDQRIWEQLCRRASKSADRRVLVSSELFSDARDDMIPGIVDGLGKGRVRVLVTVRPLEKLLPSTWQQGVKNGATSTYDRWLRHVLKGPQHDRLSKTAAKFWSRHDHARLVERWAAVAGLDNVAVLIVDERQPQNLLRDAETLIGVTPGTLQPGPSRNRSLTAEEAEVIRRLYLRVNEDLDRRRSQRWIHRGAVINLIDQRKPPPDEPRLVTPADSVLRAREIGREVRDRLVATGVRIVGDPASLVPDTPVPEQSIALPSRVDDDVAVELLVGMFRAAEADARPADQVEQLTTKQLLAEVRQRAARKVKRQQVGESPGDEPDIVLPRPRDDD